MSEGSPANYNEGDIAWVKLGPSWWPGEVVDLKKLPEEMATFKKPPLVIVKFFDEEKYEYVRSWSNIYPYNSDKKSDFIKKGMASHRSKMVHMEKFPKDVTTAEIRSGGNPNILSDPAYLPGKKRNIVAELFGSASPKVKKIKDIKKGRVTKSSQKDMSHITHRRFLGSDNLDDYRAYICIQYPGKGRDPNDSEDNEVIRLNSEPEQEYNCHSCLFSTKSIEIMIFHTKSHLQGIYVSSTGKKLGPKKEKVKITEPKQKRIKSIRKPKSKQPKPDKPPQPMEQPEPAKSIALPSELLAEWDDSDEEDGEAGPSSILTTSQDSSVIDSNLESTLNNTTQESTLNDSQISSMDTDVDESLNKSADTENISDSVNSVESVEGNLIEQEQSKSEEIFSKIEKTEHSLKSDTVSNKIKGQSKSDRDVEIKGTIKMDKSTQEAIKSCFDFDEDDEEEPPLVSTVIAGRKIPRVIPLTERKKSNELDFEVESFNKDQILKVSESFTKKHSEKDEESEDLDMAFKELMESTALPELPDIQNTLKCEQNFHNIETIKFPDKPIDAGGSSPPKLKTDKTESIEIATKLTNPKKRFVKSFEDFELMQNKIRKTEQGKKISAQSFEAFEMMQNKIRIKEEENKVQNEYEEDQEMSPRKIEEHEEAQKISFANLKTKIMSKIIEEANIEQSSKNKIMSSLNADKIKAEDCVDSTVIKPRTRRSLGMHRTPRSKILESYRNQNETENEEDIVESEPNIIPNEVNKKEEIRESVPPKKSKWSVGRRHPKKDHKFLIEETEAGISTDNNAQTQLSFIPEPSCETDIPQTMTTEKLENGQEHMSHDAMLPSAINIVPKDDQPIAVMCNQDSKEYQQSSQYIVNDQRSQTPLMDEPPFIEDQLSNEASNLQGNIDEKSHQLPNILKENSQPEEMFSSTSYSYSFPTGMDDFSPLGNASPSLPENAICLPPKKSKKRKLSKSSDYLSWSTSETSSPLSEVDRIEKKKRHFDKDRAIDDNLSASLQQSCSQNSTDSDEKPVDGNEPAQEQIFGGKVETEETKIVSDKISEITVTEKRMLEGIVPIDEVTLDHVEQEENIEEIKLYLHQSETIIKGSAKESIEKSESSLEEIVQKPVSLVEESFEKSELLVEESVEKSELLVEESVEKSELLVEESIEKSKTLVDESVKISELLVEGLEKSELLVEESIEKSESLVEKSIENSASLVEEGVEKSELFLEESFEKSKSLVEESVEKPDSLVEESVKKSESLVEESQAVSEYGETNLEPETLINTDSSDVITHETNVEDHFVVIDEFNSKQQTDSQVKTFIKEHEHIVHPLESIHETSGEQAHSNKSEIILDRSETTIDQSELVVQPELIVEQQKSIDQSKSDVDQVEMVTDKYELIANQSELSANQSKLSVDQLELIVDKHESIVDQTESIIDQSKIPDVPLNEESGVHTKTAVESEIVIDVTKRFDQIEEVADQLEFVVHESKTTDPPKTTDQSKSSDQSKKDVNQLESTSESGLVVNPCETVMDKTKIQISENVESTDEFGVAVDLSDMVINKSEIQITDQVESTDESAVLDQPETVIDETKIQITDSFVTADGSDVVVNRSETIIDTTKIITDTESAVIEKSEQNEVNNSKVIDGGYKQAEETIEIVCNELSVERKENASNSKVSLSSLEGQITNDVTVREETIIQQEPFVESIVDKNEEINHPTCEDMLNNHVSPDDNKIGGKLMQELTNSVSMDTCEVNNEVPMEQILSEEVVTVEETSASVLSVEKKNETQSIEEVPKENITTDTMVDLEEIVSEEVVTEETIILNETFKQNDGTDSVACPAVSSLETGQVNEVEICTMDNDVKFAIQTNLSNLTSKEEISAMALATLGETKSDSDSNTFEDLVKMKSMPESIFSQSQSELVPIEGNLTVVSEKDLADGQVEITPKQVINSKKPIMLSNFSMDFSESSSTGNEPFDSKGTEFTSSAITKELKPPKKAIKKANTYERLELLDILEGKSDQDRKVKDKQTVSKSFVADDGICDFEEHIPSQIVCAETLRREKEDELKEKNKEKDVKGRKNSIMSTTSKLLERLSEHKTKETTKPLDTKKSFIKVTKPKLDLRFNKTMSPSQVSDGTKLTIKPKKLLDDIEDVQAFVIHKDIKKTDVEPEGENIVKTTKIMKPLGKAKILQQTIITPAGEIIQPAGATQQTDDNIFDINSMPIVLSDEILTPESIEKMPIVIGTDTTVAKPISHDRVLVSTAGGKPVLKKFIGKLATTNTVLLNQPAAGKTSVTTTKIPKIPKILHRQPTQVIPGMSKQQGKFIIVPQSAGLPNTKFTSKKPTLIKRSTNVPSILSKLPNVTSESSGHKVMIVTDQKGQQQRVILTPAHQKMLGFQSTGAKFTKTIVKSNTLPKNILTSEQVPLKTGTIVGQKLIIGTSSNTNLIMTNTQQVASSQLRTVKTVSKRLQPLNQKVATPKQKTIVISTKQAHAVRKTPGTEDELEKQVAEQLEAIRASSSAKFGVQPKISDNLTVNKTVVTKTPRRSYSKKTEVKPKTTPPPLAELHSPRIELKKSESSQLSSDMKQSIITSESKAKPDRPLNQLVIQDALGNQTTITEGQILALPSETVDGQPQSYMLVTLDESGNLTPLNNEALMSLDPNLGGDLSNMVLQIDQSALTGNVVDQRVPLAQPAIVKTNEPIKIDPTPLMPPTRTTEIVAENIVEQKVPEPLPISEPLVPSSNSDPGQQLIVTGDPIATQKFLESLTEGTTDLANILANADGNSILIQADGQQILINTNADNQMMLSVNNDINTSENTEGGGNPIFATQPTKNQDILAAALADTDVFQSDQHSQSKIVSQLSPNNALYPMNVGNVLETSLTLSSPIMTPLEVPSTNSKKIPDEADILTQVPKNVDLPITITDPNISQTVANQKVASLIANELHSNLELSLPISETTISTVSTDMNSPSYSYSLPTLDDTVDLSHKPFNSSMPLLTEEAEETNQDSKSAKIEESSDIHDNHKEEIIRDNEDSSSVDSKKPDDSINSDASFLDDEGRFTLGGEMCSSLSEPPPEMFDLPERSSDTGDNLSKDGDTDISSHGDSSNEGSCEIPLQPQIVAKAANLESFKRNFDGLEENGRTCKFD